MKLIGTHNSATGEKGKGLLSFILSPFCKCQSKTILEQYKSGCRYFDLRIRHDGTKWYACHGLWKCKKSVTDILVDLCKQKDDVYVMITYEGKYTHTDELLIEAVQTMIKPYGNIILNEVNIKKPIWRCIYRHKGSSQPYRQAYKCLDGGSWHTYLPIPWLWNKLYRDEKLIDNIYNFVDFL